MQGNMPVKRLRYNARRTAGVVGQSPGVVITPEDALKPLIGIISYNARETISSKGQDIKVVFDQLERCCDHTHWIQVRGLGDAALIEEIGAILNINPLVLEDISNIHQRPKFDDYDGYFFVVSRMIDLSTDYELTNHQFSALVKDNIIVSFEETHQENFEAVKNRIAAGKGVIRTAGAGYLCYALTDTVLDRYFALLAQLGDQLDGVEDRLYSKVDKTIMYETQQLKRTLIVLRRACWPERDKINDMLRTENPLVSAELKIFLRDAYDHCIQIMDLIESYKEITSSIMDIYLSMVSNRMNEIMKVLTIISVIFIPLTFIAGIYGMNFSRVDPATNKVMPDNLPELYNPHGYFYALGGMAVIAIIQVVIFWKKGWFNKL